MPDYYNNKQTADLFVIKPGDGTNNPVLKNK